MKKITMLLISLLLIFCLSSCANIKKDLEFSQDRANVQSIEIFNPEKSYYEGDIHAFLEENEPIWVLESEKYSVFLDFGIMGYSPCRCL